MSRTRSWTLGAVALSLVILLGGWFLLVSPKKSQASDLEAQAATVQGQNANLTTQIATLKAQNAQLPEHAAKLAKFRQQLPDNPALPGLIRSLSDIAKTSGVELVSLAPATPIAAKAPAASTPTTPPSGTQPSSATAGGVTASTAQTQPLQVINVAIVVKVSYFDAEQFFNKAEGLTRSLLVTGFTMAPYQADSSTAGTTTAGSTSSVAGVRATIQARVFYSPATPTS